MAMTPRNRDRNLRKTFGISTEQFNQLAIDQKHVCFICQGTDSFSDHLAVDHCHQTTIVRGLLCRNCNRALGQFQDSVELLKRAIIYLERDPPKLGKPAPPAPHKPYKDRPRWFCRVSTPDGTFNSYQEAGLFYNVHATTVREWCVGSKNKRDGFSSEKVFAT